MTEGVVQLPTTRLRWSTKFDGRDHNVTVLEQLWHIQDFREGKYHTKEEWREVPHG